MAIVVVGGQGRNVGKTGVIAGIIAALPEMRWTAVKVSQHPHDLAAGGQSWAITAEHDRDGSTDSSRYLAAGAVRALWLRTLPGRLAEAMPRLREEMATAENVILESNSVMAVLQPDLYLMVLDAGNPDCKALALQFLARADAFILTVRPPEPPEANPAFMPPSGKPVFRITPPPYVTPELADFVRIHLQTASAKR